VPEFLHHGEDCSPPLDAFSLGKANQRVAIAAL
jgi:hypothetical protein